jgi:YidC/Oxa1 family membrane protein insertase
VVLSVSDVLVLPVSALLLAWHRALETVLDPGGGAGWTAAVVLLVVTLRLALLLPALRQLQATRRLRALGPQLAALRARRLDREELARQTLALQRAHGAGPGATLLPVLVQLPVVLGLFLLLTQLARSTAGVGALDSSQVASFAAAELLGAPLVATDGPMLLGLLAAVGLVLHLTARLALRRQPPEAGVATTLAGASLWVFPVFPLLGALVVPVPVAVAVYWLTTNLWTLAQTELLHGVLDRRDA